LDDVCAGNPKLSSLYDRSSYKEQIHLTFFTIP
jgi:hypothetical protein